MGVLTDGSRSHLNPEAAEAANIWIKGQEPHNVCALTGSSHVQGRAKLKASQGLRSRVVHVRAVATELLGHNPTTANTKSEDECILAKFRTCGSPQSH